VADLALFLGSYLLNLLTQVLVLLAEMAAVAIY
jgi:hypothetical protein